jgi:hypothetical protein
VSQRSESDVSVKTMDGIGRFALLNTTARLTV